MTKRKKKAAEIYDPAKGTAKAQAQALARERRQARAAQQFLRPLMRRRLLYIASLRDFAAAAAEAKPGYDGTPPEIVDAPEPGDNPQLRVSRNLREHPLDLMAHKRQITVEQFAAGDLYRRDLELAQISPMTGRNLESIYTVELSNAKALKEAGLEEALGPKTFAARAARQPMRWDDLRPVTLDAMDRANRARVYVERVAGRKAAEIVTHFCRDRLTVSEIGAAGRFGARNAVGKHLQAALDALADHYGTRARRQGCVRSWGDGSHVPHADVSEMAEAAE